VTGFQSPRRPERLYPKRARVSYFLSPQLVMQQPRQPFGLVQPKAFPKTLLFSFQSSRRPGASLEKYSFLLLNVSLGFRRESWIPLRRQHGLLMVSIVADRAVCLTRDHRANDQQEKARVEAAGGTAAAVRMRAWARPNVRPFAGLRRCAPLASSHLVMRQVS